MAYVAQGAGALDYEPCLYGMSKLQFRGPRRRLDRPYIALLGGTETYGKFIAQPYGALLEEELGTGCVNLGVINAGLDLYLHDPALLRIATQAQRVVVQVMGAQNLTNRFYAVHPRRNDRFVAARPELRSLFPEVDFTEFSFTRHLLHGLRRISVERFAVVAAEVQRLWVERMGQLLALLPQPVLFWFAEHVPPEAPQADLGCDPLLVDAAMLRAVQAQAAACLEVVTGGMTPPGKAGPHLFAQPELLGLPGAVAHQVAARRLAALLA